ncbi:hypothetical protein FRB94_011254 [Tulasnella sp. JGI-2019a]|nr:hypothetical protein FRB93_002894 [Tulasnella sp. JGI-2019a]KAG8992879.1 hypothetical protein FRB94_011254 [Tulasnella sp. JGI-2019a]
MTVQQGIYRIKNRKSGTYLDASVKHRGEIHGWDIRPDNDNQKWHVEECNENFKLKNVEFNEFVSVRGHMGGDRIVLSHNPTEWEIQDRGHGAYSIAVVGKDLCIDLDMGRSENGTHVSVWSWHGAEQQYWRFERVDNLPGGEDDYGSGYGGRHGGGNQQGGGTGGYGPGGGGSGYGSGGGYQQQGGGDGGYGSGGGGGGYGGGGYQQWDQQQQGGYGPGGGYQQQGGGGGGYGPGGEGGYGPGGGYAQQGQQQQGGGGGYGPGGGYQQQGQQQQGGTGGYGPGGGYQQQGGGGGGYGPGGVGGGYGPGGGYQQQGQQPQGQGPTGMYSGAIPPGSYILQNALTGTAADLAGSGTADGTPITGWTCTKAANQTWDLVPAKNGYHFLNSASGTYLGFESGGGSEGTLVHGSSRPVEWQVTQANQGYSIRLASSPNIVLDLAGGGNADGVKICLYSDHGGPNQQWKFSAI